MSCKQALYVSITAAGLLCTAAVPVSAHTTTPAAAQLTAPSADGLAAAVTRARQAARPARYTVRRGDSLTAIARRFYHKPAAWPVLYWANHRTVRWANIIVAGQPLTIPAAPARIPAAPRQLAPYVPPPAAPRPVRRVADYRSGPAYTRRPAAGYSGGTSGGSFGACVVARESGGNSQVMNASGHYGLYQFSEATWVAYGGSAADFGHASAAEQNQVFAAALARGGQDNWSPYDGC